MEPVNLPQASRPSLPSLGFMDLPPEIRNQIYRLSLELSCRSIGLTIYDTWYYNLASTCRQLRFEALPLVLAQKNLGQMKFEQLLEWISTGTPQNLAMIRTLDITLDRDCFEALEESPRLAEDLCKFVPEKGSLFIHRYGEKFRPHPGKMVGNIVTWSNTKSRNTIAALWNAFTSFPSIENLSINLGCETRHSRNSLIVGFVIHYRQEKELILEMLPSAFPNLLSFTLRSSPLRLSYLQHFQHLRHLKCSGHFNSKPENTVAILHSLKTLVKITLEQPNGPSLTQIRPGALQSQQFCLTPEIVSQLNPLESFHSISTQRAGIFDAVKLTAPWISALLSHSSSLKDFRMLQMVSHLQHDINIKEILDFMCFSPIPDMSLQLLLPKKFATMDPNYLVAPQTGKVVDILAYTPYAPIMGGSVLFKVNTGRYLPSAAKVEERNSLFEVKAGQTVLKEKYNKTPAFKERWEKAKADAERRGLGWDPRPDEIM